MKKKKTIYSVVMRILSLIICLLILFTLALARDGRIWGMEISEDENSAPTTELDTATVTVLGDGTYVVNTTNLTKDVKGYAGPTPLKVYIREGRIDNIEVLSNVETPDFLNSVVTEILPQYKGKAVNEAVKMEVDAVSGATFSSNAIKANIAAALQTVERVHQEQQSSAIEKWFKGLAQGKGWGELCAVIVALLAAILPIYIKSKTYRMMQLVLNVMVLGLWSGSFLNYSVLVGYMSNGINLTISLAMIVLLVVAFIYPLFGKRNYYCAWCCPMGSAQDLAFSTKGKWHAEWRKRLALSPGTLNKLRLFRRILWLVLMFLSWLGVTFSWMDYELFTAFIWQAASWIVIIFCILTIIISVFIPRPYCRFVCPTGTLLKIL